MKISKKIILILLLTVLTILVTTVKVRATDEITSTLYTIDKTNNIISRVVPGTTIATFKSKLSGSQTLKVYTDKTCKTEVTSGNMKTGMEVKYGETSTYSVSVIGDITGDGEVDLTDLNNIINYYLKISLNTQGDYELKGEFLASANISEGSSEIDLTDINEMVTTVVESDIPERDKPTETTSKTVSSIAIATAPSKTTYTVGEKFDTTGLTLKVTYSDDTTEIISSGFSWAPATLNTAGTQNITITYNNKTTTTSVTVNAVATKTVSKIEVATEPSKTTYTVGEKFDTTGLTLKVTYSDDTTEIISSGFSWAPATLNTAGTQIITITYEETTTTTEVTVMTPVTEVSLNKSTISLVVGEEETLTATVAPSNASNKNVTWSSDDIEVATVDNSGKVTAVAAGTATITVTTEDGGFTATCEVTI